MQPALLGSRSSEGWWRRWAGRCFSDPEACQQRRLWLKVLQQCPRSSSQEECRRSRDDFDGDGVQLNVAERLVCAGPKVALAGDIVHVSVRKPDSSPAKFLPDVCVPLLEAAHEATFQQCGGYTAADRHCDDQQVHKVEPAAHELDYVGARSNVPGKGLRAGHAAGS